MRISLPITFILMIAVAALIATCAACSRSNDPGSNWIKATVVQARDMSCGKPLLNFSDDSLRFRKIFGDTSLLWLSTTDLGKGLNIEGQKLLVEVDPHAPNPAILCLAIGFWYPQLQVLHAKAR